MNKLVQRSTIFIKRNASTILTCASGAGVVATAVMAVKATPKAIELLEVATREKGEELTKTEVVKVAGPSYIPTVIAGIATIACIFGANVLNKHQQAALMSAYALLDSTYKDYQKKVEELYGTDVNDRIKEEIAKDKYIYEQESSMDDDKKLFYDEFSGRYFESTTENVLRAEYNLNRRLSEFDSVYLNEFYKMLNLPPVDYGTYIGWSGAEIWGSQLSACIDFNHKKVTMDDGLECYIVSWTVDPTFGFDNH